jgi:hypothetical protein
LPGSAWGSTTVRSSICNSDLGQFLLQYPQLILNCKVWGFHDGD